MGIVLLIMDKNDFESESIMKDEEEYFIMIHSS